MNDLSNHLLPPDLASSTHSIHSCSSKRTRSRRGSSKPRKQHRAVLKNGECNVLQNHIHHRRLHYLQDIFTTLVDVQWRWTLSLFALSFILSWTTFAAFWWLICTSHGDFLPESAESETWIPCVVNVNSFSTAFLFSLETQQSIGYGTRSMTSECPEAMFVMIIQVIVGLIIEACTVGIVFAKLSRPKLRTQTLLFSRHAVVCQRDGDLCLMFRVGDIRKSHIVGAKVRAVFISTRKTSEGEILTHYRTELKVGIDGGNRNLFFIWPATVVHHITPRSPLYSISAHDLIDGSVSFEIVVVLEGTTESTAQITQARSSYLPNEILWGHRFEPLVKYDEDLGGYEVDYSLFDKTLIVDTPLCSARELQQYFMQDDHSSRNSDLDSDSGTQSFASYNSSNGLRIPHVTVSMYGDTGHPVTNILEWRY